MHNIDNPGPMPEPPSSRRLLRSTLIALSVAVAILVVIVLPAEYGVDPTGVGRLLGLKEMGEIKMQLAREEAGAAGGEGATTAQANADTSPDAHRPRRLNLRKLSRRSRLPLRNRTSRKSLSVPTRERRSSS